MAEGEDAKGKKAEEIDEAKISQIKKEEKNLEVVAEIPLEIKCVLGSTNMTVNQLLKLAKGSVVELDKTIGDPIDLIVNGKLVAKGEVVIVEDKIGITLTEVIKD